MFIPYRKHDLAPQKQNNNMVLKRFLIVIFVCVTNVFVGYAQENELSVNDILTKAQQVFANTQKYTVEVDYKMFGNYKTTKPLEAFSGVMVKNNASTYLKIHNTTFITNQKTKTSVKVFNEDKIIEVAKQTTEIVSLDNTSPVNIENFIKLFKYKKVEDKGAHYLCTLTTDKITQIPYGRVEIYIQKTDFHITKQVLYFLANVPYKDHNGEQQKGNPRLEVTISNYKDALSKTQEGIAELSQYIIKSGGAYKPSTAYKDFKIIQN